MAHLIPQGWTQIAPPPSQLLTLGTPLAQLPSGSSVILPFSQFFISFGSRVSAAGDQLLFFGGAFFQMKTNAPSVSPFLVRMDLLNYSADTIRAPMPGLVASAVVGVLHFFL